MQETKQTRWAKQPREYPNCGSVFKRPPVRFVGPMLDELGMKAFHWWCYDFGKTQRFHNKHRDHTVKTFYQ